MNFMTRADLIRANKALRKDDDSGSWPINGRFNATERAIRRVRQLRHHNSEMSFYEYIDAVQAEASEIVNDERNWR